MNLYRKVSTFLHSFPWFSHKNLHFWGDFPHIAGSRDLFSMRCRINRRDVSGASCSRSVSRALQILERICVRDLSYDIGLSSRVRMIWSKFWDLSNMYFTRSDANCWIISTNVVIKYYKPTDTDWDDLKENLQEVMIWVYHGLPMLQVRWCLTFKHTSTILLITF